MANVVLAAAHFQDEGAVFDYVGRSLVAAGSGLPRVLAA